MHADKRRGKTRHYRIRAGCENYPRALAYPLLSSAFICVHLRFPASEVHEVGGFDELLLMSGLPGRHRQGDH
jgi:hypothetical protein